MWGQDNEIAELEGLWGGRCLSAGRQDREERECVPGLSQALPSCDFPTMFLNLSSLEKSNIYPFSPFVVLGNGDTVVGRLRPLFS